MYVTFICNIFINKIQIIIHYKESNNYVLYIWCVCVCVHTHLLDLLNIYASTLYCNINIHTHTQMKQRKCIETAVFV